MAKQASTEPQWKTVERVVALLEKTLAPEARIRHDIKLPNLKTGHPIQCDVVIEKGQEPRITRSIVEVQDRSRPVEANTFRGWCKKMDDVGASHLVCVSAHPFPESIKDTVATEYGPRVLLVTLEALEKQQWPLQIVNGAMRIYNPTIDVDTSITPNPVFIFPPGPNPIMEAVGTGMQGNTQNRWIQREGQEELLPVGDLINEGVRKLNDNPQMLRLSEGLHRVVHRWRPQGVSFCYNGLTASVQQLEVTYLVRIESVIFPFEISSYSQEGHTLAWVARASGKINGEDAEIRFTFVPDGEGCFRMSHTQTCGFKAGGFVFFGQVDDQPAPLG
jgi:hypothetical protein